MVESTRAGMALLGLGGERPGVVALSGDGRHLARVAELDEGNSVYALDAAPDALSLLLGSRGGSVHSVPLPSDSDPRAGGAVGAATGLSSFPSVGAPVLSVCHMGEHGAVVASLHGAFLLPTGDANAERVILETEGREVCALQRLGPLSLAGLTTDGHLLTWSLPGPALEAGIAAEEPPDCWALVALVYDVARGAIFYPGRSGTLVKWEPGERGVETAPAHDRGWCALCACGEQLVTVGRSDGRLTVWDLDSLIPIEHVNGAPNTVAACRHGLPTDRRLLLIDTHGAARLATLESGSLSATVVAVRDCRTVWALDDRRLHATTRAEAAKAAHRVTLQIMSLRDKGDLNRVAVLHTELENLGYAHVSLALKAEQARKERNEIQELRVREQLTMAMGGTEPLGRDLALRYAQLLEKHWQLDAAVSIQAQLQALWPSLSLPWDADTLTTRSAAAAQTDALVVPDIPVSAVMAASRVTGRPLAGRWVCASGRPLVCREGTLTVHDIHHHVQDRTSGAEAVGVLKELGTLRIVSREGVRSAEVLLLSEDRSQGNEAWQLGIEVTPAGSDSVVTVMAVVRPALLRDSARVSARLEQEGRTLEAIATQFLNGLGRVVTESLRRAITVRASCRRRGNQQ